MHSPASFSPALIFRVACVFCLFSTPTWLARADDADPIEHITFLASDAMKGRSSPSPEFDLSAAYVQTLLVKYGLTGPNPTDTNGAYAQTFLAAPTDAASSRNVLGLLQGTGPHSSEVFVVMAHLDHLGVSGTGVVYNGADDNGSGSAAILATLPALRNLQQSGQLDRSVLFLWTAGEERGLLGSEYFVNHPLPGLPLANIVGVINVDMIGRWEDERISIVDTDATGQPNSLSGLFDRANSCLPEPFTAVHRDIGNLLFRQDGFAFLNAGKSVIFLYEGDSNSAGGGNIIPEYHQPEDDVDRILNENGGTKVVRARDLLIEFVKQVANQ